MFSFVPRHAGIFTVEQVVDIIGPVAKKDSLSPLRMKSFQQIRLSFSGVCKSVTNKVVLKTNLGMLSSIKRLRFQ